MHVKYAIGTEQNVTL